MIQKPEQILYGKLTRFCDYRDRCTNEIEQKFRELEAEESHKSIVLKWLKEGEHFSDELFAKSFTSGKFRIKGWGKMKIKAALFAKRIPEHLIKSAESEIDLDDYRTKATQLIQRKIVSKKIDHHLRQKVIRSMFIRGYDSSLVIDILLAFQNEEKEASL